MVGPFDIDEATARRWMVSSEPFRRYQPGRIRKRYIATDLCAASSTDGSSTSATCPESEAAKYIVPFQHFANTVKPPGIRTSAPPPPILVAVFGESRPALREALPRALARYIATPDHSEHRVFVWLDTGIPPDQPPRFFPTKSTYTFGVLQSHIHTLWALRQGSSLEDRARYTPTVCFETFPFPRPAQDGRETVASWAKYLRRSRRGILDADDSSP